MQRRQTPRRDFLRTAGSQAAGVVLAGTAGAAARAAEPTGSSPSIRIETPFHGGVLNSRHGVKVDGGLRIQVAGQASQATRVTVNGVEARRQAGRFEAEIVIADAETDIVAKLHTPRRGVEDRVRVVWDRYSFPRYRFSVDDNSFFLRDIAEKQYRSLFDCWYLKIFRDLHQKYGARFALNIYYTTGDDFSLPDFPDRYKSEWSDNSDWLRLAFHAWANDPDRPYQDAEPAKLIADFDQVAEQIVRFAGEQAYSPPTVIHWGMCRQEALKPLYERGVRALSGYFVRWGDKWDVNYNFDDRRSEYLSQHDAWMDFDSGIVFSRVDIVCNNKPIDQIVPTLSPLADDPDTAELMDLFTHEQYFWPFYRNHIPDHAQRLDTAIRWVTERGYRAVFYHQGFLGGPRGDGDGTL